MGVVRDWEYGWEWDSAYDYALRNAQVGFSAWDPCIRIKPEINCEDVACAYAMARVMGMVPSHMFWRWAEAAGLAERIEDVR